MAENSNYIVSDEALEDLIRKYCVDMTALAREGFYDPITGRDDEIDETILIILQKGRKNACLVGAAGVGKTAMVSGLAQRVAAGDVPDYLKDARILSVDLALMAAGTASQAQFQDRFIPLCRGVAERYHNPDLPRIVLFIDELHHIMPNCEGSAYAGVSAVIKPYLTAGDLIVIGATTLDEFRTYIQIDATLDRRFQRVPLKIPDAEETYHILKSLQPGFEDHHRVTISDVALMLIVQLTEEHMRKRNQPDKSIITLDAAMAHHVMNNGIGGEISFDPIYHMLERETGLNKNAMHDEKKIQRITQQIQDMGTH